MSDTELPDVGVDVDISVNVAVDVADGGTDAGFARALCLPIGASSAAERSRRPLRTGS